MGTLAIGAPLLAGGPPGWVLYGLLGVATLVVAVDVYEASHDADNSFPQTAPSCVQPCPPVSQAATQDETQTRAEPITKPLPTCATQHPGVILCSTLPWFYTYTSIQVAFRAIRDLQRGTIRLEKNQTDGFRSLPRSRNAYGRQVWG